MVVSRGQLDFLKAKIAAGEQPWAGIADALKRQSYASPTYKAKPVPNVICGPYSNPSVGCADEWKDGMAAYAQAMLWYVTGDEAYAKNAIAIMNAWSSTLKGHSNSNGPLQQGWAGAMWPRGAEIIRHTYNGWAAADIARFETMLRTQYLPGVINGSGANGNWELTMIDAAIGIAVFLDDKAAFDKAVTMWRQRVPAYFYLSSDGPKPVPAPRGSTNWQGATVYMDGIAQETCRDLTHTQYGIASAMYVAETALIQGVDLYKEQEKRLATTVEFHAAFLDGVSPPSWLCGGSLSRPDRAPHLGDRLQPLRQPAGHVPAAHQEPGHEDPPHRRRPPHVLGEHEPRPGRLGGPEVATARAMRRPRSTPSAGGRPLKSSVWGADVYRGGAPATSALESPC